MGFGAYTGVSLCNACSNTKVCLSTSLYTVYGHINAILWKGVIKIPRFNINKCINSSSISFPAFTDWPPFFGAGLTNLYYALAPSWEIDHGMLYLSRSFCV